MNLTSTIFTVTLLQFLVLNSVFAQTGPGGVGNSTNNMLWLKADAATYTDAGTTLTSTDGQAVQQWNSVSGQTYNAIQASASSKPLYKTNIANGYPALLFDGSNDWMGITINVAETNFSQFVVFQTQANDGDGCFIAITDPVSPSAGSHDRQFGLTGNKLAHRLWSEQTITSTSNFNNNAVHVADILVSSTTGQTIHSDGALVASGNKTASDFNWESGMVLGGHAWGYIYAYIPEIIYYNTLLNSVQRLLVQNYLSAKYNFPLTNNDIYTQDNPANGNFDYDVAGIGRINASNIHNDAQGSGMLRVLNPSNLNDNEFLTWGHNNVSTAATFTDLPTGVLAKLGRVWRVSETNSTGTAVDVGNIDMRWDLSAFGTLTAADLRLIIDTNNDGFFADETAISGATFLGSNIYQFAGVSAIANNSRFTIGTANTTTSPLPISLIEFNASAYNNQSVELNWSTASENNNDFFTLEKSTDGSHWEFVSQVQGAGNSSSTTKYHSNDTHPYTGLSYYRLSQTDYNQQTTFTEIVSVNLNSTGNIKLYPNPTSHLLTVQSNEEELKDFIIYNSYGQSMNSNFIITESSPLQTVLDLSKLQQGVYSLKTKNQTLKFFKL